MSQAQTAPSSSPPAPPARAEPSRIQRLRGLIQSEFGSVRVVIVLAIIWVIFEIANDNFLRPVNLTNLALQTADVACISVGVVLVLLLGEIDLSVGAVSGFAAAVTAVLNVKTGWNPYLAMGAGLATGALVGLFQGTIITRLAIPSFVVTLAGLLAWQGALLEVLGDTGTVNLNDPAITNLAHTFLPKPVGWVMGLAASAAIAFGAVMRRRQRAAAGMESKPVVHDTVRVVASAVAILAAVAVVNQDRGVPTSLIILVVIIMAFSYLTTRTRWGRHVYAVGGNLEAARRAGIRTTGIRTAVFVLGSTLAAAGGILAASRLFAVNQSSGGSDLLLFAIAGPVIAGVSLFGGRGIVWAALLGGLVIQSISNGMFLLSLSSSVRFIITGAVLLAAVSLDALATKKRRSTGRA